MEYVWNRFSVKRSTHLSISEYLFERTLTFDPTVDRHQIFTGVPDAGFRGVDVESLLGEAEVSRSTPEYRFERAITFDPTV